MKIETGKHKLRLPGLFNLLKLAIGVSLFTSSSIAQDTRQLTVEKPAVPAAAEKRIALVIGNGNYSAAPKLANPVNDANDMAETLGSLGFEVLLGTDKDKRGMETLIRQFGDKLYGSNGVGLFFYAGHGLQSRGSNFLVPIDAEIAAEDEIAYSAVNLNFVLGKMESAKNNLNIVILDACRNNPFARSWRNYRDVGEGSGLAKVTPPNGTIMLYSTQPGNVASDGEGRNGLFTESLLQQINQPGIELDAMVKSLARDVSEKSNKKQLPWKEGIVLGDFYFSGGKGTAQPVSSVPLPDPNVVDSRKVEDAMWNSVVKLNTRAAFAGYLAEYPKGRYAATANLNIKILDEEVANKVKLAEGQKWEEARKLETVEGYQNYLKAYPNGEKKDDANQRIKDLTAELTFFNRPQQGKSITNALGMLFMGVPDGSFLMGASKNEKGKEKDETQRNVTLTKGFWLGQFEVTESQWRRVMGSVPEDCYEKKGQVRGDSRPVVCVSWDDVQAFISKLNAKGDGTYRLPTEAEWEYAARAGTIDRFYWGSEENDICEYASVKERLLTSQTVMGKTTVTCKDAYIGAAPVGKFIPNNFGVYDMAGNVWEWVNDWYGEYSRVGETDPAGPATGTARVYRGGSAFTDRDTCRSANREFGAPSLKSHSIGFRLVREH